MARTRLSPPPPSRPRRRGMTYAAVRAIGLKLPGMEDATSYGTPALKVRGKLVVRLREDGETLALRIGFLERAALLATDPEAFFLTDHYRNHPAVVVRLDAVRRVDLARLLTDTWQQLAPRTLVAKLKRPAARES